MEFWDEKAKPTLLVAVKAACEAIREDLATELQQRDRSRYAFLTEEVNRLGVVAARAEQLEKENQQLRQQLEELREKPHASISGAPGAPPFCNSERPVLIPSPSAIAGRQSHTHGRQVLGEISPNKVTPAGRPGWEQGYKSLAKRYTALEARFAAKRSAAQKIKDDRDGWMKYAERQEAKVKKLEKKLQHQGVADAPSSSATSRPTALQAVGAADATFNTSFASNSESNTGPGVAEAAEEARFARRSVSTPATAKPQQQTRYEPENTAPANNETSDEDAEEHELPLVPHLHQPNHHVVFKQEPSSDVPVVVSERNLRKRKNEETDDLRVSSYRIKSEHGISSDPVVTGELTAFSPHESLDLDAEQGWMPTPKKQKVTRTEGHGAGTVGGSTSAPSTDNTRRTTKRSLPWHVGDPKQSVATDWNLDHRAADVVGDGEAPSSPSLERTPQVPNPGLSGRKRLQDLLNHAPSGSDPVLLRPIRQAQLDPFDTELDLMALKFGKKKTDTSVKTPARELHTSKFSRSLSSGSVQKGKRQSKLGSLRGRPLADLRIEDFKVNPKFNNGYKHAFDEVVRDKAGRAELEGCVDPNCCGKKFRAMAQSELDNGGPGILSREADVRLVEEYLGDEAYRLIGMTHEDREKIWLEAKTRDLANKYGRHRHRYARRPSPPGFWNPDFPTTQEVQENREEGEKIERKMIEERWREAMKAGGRWLFKDE